MAIIKRVVGQITLTRVVDIVSTTYFYLLMPSIAAAPNKPEVSPPPVYTTDGYNGWSETEPGYTSGDTRSLYITIRTTYSDGSFNYTTPSLSSSYEAAKEAYNRAQSAMSLAGDINQYFWNIPTAYSTNVPAGAYITEVQQSLFKPNPSGGNIVVQSTGITIRNGITQLASLTGNALNFYNPQASQNENALQLSIGANGALQSGNYSYSSGSIFSDNGTKIDLTDGTIYSPYFRILTTTLGTNQPGAYIKGDVVAQTGRFGSSTNNYWLIDTYYDANQQEYYSSLRGIGNSFIQLGSNNTWTLGTNRINSSWRYTSSDASGVTNPFLLRYKRFGNTSSDKYYDYGMNLPTILNTSDQNAQRIADKFLYIRTANYVSDNNLANLDLDTNWTYPFYVDSQGNVRAKAFYIGNSTTSIGGGAGTIAEKLMTGAGSTSQPVYFRSDTGHVGEVATIDYTIQSNVPANAIFTDHITSASTTGSGNAVTSVTADSNGNLSVTKDITFITSETDPTVPAWAKATNKPSYSYDEITGTVPQSALPSYVDDVLEYNGQSSFPTTGESGKIYVDTSTNKTYRWSGTTYVEISSSLALGETSSTAYRGDRGKTAYDHASAKGSAFNSGLYKITTNSEGHVTAAVAASKSDIGLGNVDNKSSATIRDEITSNNIITSLGYTPYDGATNPNNYITSADVSDTKVTQTNTTGNVEYRVLFSENANDTTETVGTRKNTKFKYNPSSGAVTATEFIGSLTGTASGNLTSNSALAWSKVTGTPTTLSGYGITDATIINGTITLGNNSITPFTGIAVTQLAVNIDTSDNKTYLYVTKSNSSTPQKLSLEDISIVQAQGATTLVDTSNVGISKPGPVKFVDGKPETMTGTGTDTIPWSLISGAPQTYAVDLATYNTLGGVKPLYSWTKAVAETSAGSITATAPTINSRSTTAGKYYAIEIDKNGRLFVNVPWEDHTYTIPTVTQSARTGVTISDHSTTSIYGVGSTTTTASHITSGGNGTAPTLGTAISIIGVQSSTTSVTGVNGSTTVRGVKTGTNSTLTASKASGGNGTASSWTFESRTVTKDPSFVYNSSDTSLTISFSTETVYSKTGGSNGTASTWSFTDVTVPIRADNDTTVPVAASSATTVPIKNTSATSIPNVTSVGSASNWVFEDVAVPIKNNSSTTVVTSKTHTVNDNGHSHTI